MRATKTKERVESILAADVIPALKDAVLFTSKDDGRPILRCVLVKVEAGVGITLVGTDSYTLIERTLAWPEGTETWSGRIDRDHVDLILRVLALHKGFEVEMHAEDHDVTITVPGTVLRVPLESAQQFPDYQPFTTGKRLPVNEEFALNPEFLKRIGQLSKGKGRPVVVCGQGKVKPVFFECEDTLAIIMPVRMT